VEGNDSTRGNATFDAGYEITLSEGFDAKDGSQFEANIDTNLVAEKAEAKAEAEEGGEQMTIVPIADEDGVFIFRLNIGVGEVAVVKIFDEKDKPVYENKLVGAQTKIDLSNQSTGVYTVKVWWAEKLFIEEIRIK